MALYGGFADLQNPGFQVLPGQTPESTYNLSNIGVPNTFRGDDGLLYEKVWSEARGEYVDYPAYTDLSPESELKITGSISQILGFDEEKTAAHESLYQIRPSTGSGKLTKGPLHGETPHIGIEHFNKGHHGYDEAALVIDNLGLDYDVDALKPSARRELVHLAATGKLDTPQLRESALPRFNQDIENHDNYYEVKDALVNYEFNEDMLSSESGANKIIKDFYDDHIKNDPNNPFDGAVRPYKEAVEKEFGAEELRFSNYFYHEVVDDYFREDSEKAFGEISPEVVINTLVTNPEKSFWDKRTARDRWKKFGSDLVTVAALALGIGGLEGAAAGQGLAGASAASAAEAKLASKLMLDLATFANAAGYDDLTHYLGAAIALPGFAEDLEELQNLNNASDVIDAAGLDPDNVEYTTDGEPDPFIEEDLNNNGVPDIDEGYDPDVDLGDDNTVDPNDLTGDPFVDAGIIEETTGEVVDPNDLTGDPFVDADIVNEELSGGDMALLDPLISLVDGVTGGIEGTKEWFANLDEEWGISELGKAVKGLAESLGFDLDGLKDALGVSGGGSGGGAGGTGGGAGGSGGGSIIDAYFNAKRFKDATEALQGSVSDARDSVNTYYGQADDQLVQGLETGRSDLMQGQTDALSALDQYYNTGRTDLMDALEKSRGYVSPWYEAGKRALAQQEGLLGLSQMPGDKTPTELLRETPGYQFRLNEGTRAVQNQMAARGLSASGEERKELMKYGQGLADTTFNSRLNQLAQLSGLGASIGTQMGRDEMTTGQSLAGLAENTGARKSDVYTGTGTNLASLSTGTAANRANVSKARGNELGRIELLGGKYTSNMLAGVPNVTDNSLMQLYLQNQI